MLQALLDHIAAHWVIYSTTGTALGFATVSCMPAKFPRSIDEWWTWFRDSLQTAIPGRRPNTNPTIPVSPDKK